MENIWTASRDRKVPHVTFFETQSI